MVISTASASFISQRERDRLARGMMSLVIVKPLASAEIHRFPAAGNQGGWPAASQGLGRSAHETLLQPSRSDQAPRRAP